jgi:hypothetical protein
MTRFDGPFDTEQPADGLADELRRMLARREADITEPARPRMADERLALPPHRTHQVVELPGGWTGTLLAAAAVVLLVLGSVLAIRAFGPSSAPTTNQPGTSGPAPSSAVPSASSSPSSSPSPVRTACAFPPAWSAAISAGLIAVDQPQNYPISAGPDGSFLMLQSATGPGPGGETDFTHQELAIFDRSGRGTTIWTAADPAHDEVDVSPDSATSRHWVVFGLSREQNQAAHGVVAWNRASGSSTTVRLLSAAEQAANTVIAFDPIVVGDTAYWIEQPYPDPRHQTLVAQRLPTGNRRTTPVSQVQRLVATAGGVLLLRGPGAGTSGTTPDEDLALAAGPDLVIPADVIALGVGRDFVSDGATVRWLSILNGTSTLLSWRPGNPAVGRDAAVEPPAAAQLVGPFLVGQSGGNGSSILLDIRNGSRHTVPAGTGFPLAAGSDLILTSGTTKFGSTKVYRVAASALAPAGC